MLTHSTFLYIKFQPTLNTGKLRYVHLIFMRINKHTTDPFEINAKYANLEKGRRKKKTIEESLMGSECMDLSWV